MEATDAQASREPKIDDYAYEAIDRVLNKYYSVIGKELKDNGESKERIKEIAYTWDPKNRERMDQLRQSFEQLKEMTASQDKGDVGQDIDSALEKLNQKISSVNKLEQRGLLGKLVGAELLKRSKREPLLLNDPLVITGIDLVVDFLAEERKLDLANENIKNAPPEIQDYHKSLIDSSSSVIQNLEELKASLQKTEANS